MKILYGSLFFICLLVVPCLGAQFTSSSLFIGDIGVIANTEASWRISDQDTRTIPLQNGTQYLEGSISEGMVSGKGDAGWKSDKDLDATGIMIASSRSAAQATDGGVAWDEAAMTGDRASSPPLSCDTEGYLANAMVNDTGAVPYSESIVGQAVVMGPNFVHNSYKTIEQGGEDSDTWLMSIAGNGTNFATMDVIGTAKVGFDENVTEQNFDMFVHQHEHKGSKTDSNYAYTGEWKSFADTFKGAEVAPVLVDETDNQVNSTNATETNDLVNNTSEEG